MLEELLGFALVFLAGCAGAGLFRLIHFPAAPIIGAMAAASFLNIMGWSPHFNAGPVSFVCAVCIGIVLGKQINRRVVCHAKDMVRPVLVQISFHLLLSLVCGYVFYLLAPASAAGALSLATALVSASTGGLTEMLVFGLSIGGDVAIIAFVQLFRLVTFLSLIPYSGKLAKFLGDRRQPLPAGDGAACAVLAPFSAFHYVLLVAAAFTGGYIGLYLQIPAGSLLGSMCFSGGLGMVLNRGYRYKPFLRGLAQIGLGVVMGQRVSAEMISGLASLFLPVLGFTAVMLAGCLVLAFVQYRTTRYDLTTCLMCSAPAGLSLSAIYAEELGIDVFTVSVFHTARMVSIVMFYPWIILHLL